MREPLLARYDLEDQHFTVEMSDNVLITGVGPSNVHTVVERALLSGVEAAERCPSSSKVDTFPGHGPLGGGARSSGFITRNDIPHVMSASLKENRQRHRTRGSRIGDYGDKLFQLRGHGVGEAESGEADMNIGHRLANPSGSTKPCLQP
jgi:hypothetical protein